VGEGRVGRRREGRRGVRGEARGCGMKDVLRYEGGKRNDYTGAKWASLHEEKEEGLGRGK